MSDLREAIAREVDRFTFSSGDDTGEDCADRILALLGERVEGWVDDLHGDRTAFRFDVGGTVNCGRERATLFIHPEATE